MSTIDDVEHKRHRDQCRAWLDRATGTAKGYNLTDYTGLVQFAYAYECALDGYEEMRVRFPGRLTAASNAIRSLEATIKALWFELEGDG